MEKLKSVVNKPIQLAILAIVFVGVGFQIQVALPYLDTATVAHGSGPHLTPEGPLALKGQEVYHQEGCQYCHTQNIRPLAWDVKRFVKTEDYGFYPLEHPMEKLYQVPSMKGSSRIGPDLARLSGKYTADQLQRLLISKGGDNLKAGLHQHYYLFSHDAKFTEMDAVLLSWKIRGMMNAGTPFSDNYQKSVFDSLEGQTRGDALVAYLLSLGRKQREMKGKFFVKN